MNGSIVFSMQMFVMDTFRGIKIGTKMAPPAPQLWGEKHPWLTPNYKCQLKVPQSWGIRGRVCQSFLACVVDPIEPDERDYLNLLGTLVYEYEEEHYPMPDIHGVE
jgi:hypothetical protein